MIHTPSESREFKDYFEIQVCVSSHESVFRSSTNYNFDSLECLRAENIKSKVYIWHSHAQLCLTNLKKNWVDTICDTYLVQIVKIN